MRFALSPNDPRVAVLVGALDHEDVPMAETWRQVCRAAERLGLPGPSYGHVRRLVRIERRSRLIRRDARGVLTGAASVLAAGRVPNAVLILERLRELERKEGLVLQEHKAFGR